MNNYWLLSINKFFSSIIDYKNLLIILNKRSFFSLNNSYLFTLINSFSLFNSNLFIYLKNFSKKKIKVLSFFRKKNLQNNNKLFEHGLVFFKISNFFKFKNSFFFSIMINYNYFFFNYFLIKINTFFVFNIKLFYVKVLKMYKTTIGEGFYYIRGLFIIFFIDMCVTDDEPLWEPLEWSLVQTWILFIFIFAWIAENLITSRYGSYTGRDKRVWFAWYKTFWLIEFWYLISYGATALFVIVPFYYELTYNISFVVSWWNWYSKIFFLNL